MPHSSMHYEHWIEIAVPYNPDRCWNYVLMCTAC
uniref:Uncharacterized protein n=1 Tax=Rhizophora mucronata TaxID=61149 RepID=A0A2P2NLI2_RHIMU